MFEKASRLKLRFDSSKGLLSVEDLWDLPLTGRGACLDGIARALHLKLKDNEVVSFVVKAKVSDDIEQLRFEIVKHVIAVRLEEFNAAKQLREKKERKAKLLDIIAEKEDQSLRDASVDDLKKMLDEL